MIKMIDLIKKLKERIDHNNRQANNYKPSFILNSQDTPYYEFKSRALENELILDWIKDKKITITDKDKIHIVLEKINISKIEYAGRTIYTNRFDESKDYIQDQYKQQLKENNNED